MLISLLFRGWDGTELKPEDAKGGTYPKKEGGCLGTVIIAFVGYVGPSLSGLGAARLIPDGAYRGRVVGDAFPPGAPRVRAPLVLRRITVPLAVGLVYVVGRYTSAGVQIVAAYAIAWFLLLSGVRGILRRMRTGSGDGERLNGLTGVPQFIWFLLWLAATLGAVAVGGKMLVMPT